MKNRQNESFHNKVYKHVRITCMISNLMTFMSKRASTRFFLHMKKIACNMNTQKVLLHVHVQSLVVIPLLRSCGTK